MQNTQNGAWHTLKHPINSLFLCLTVITRKGSSAAPHPPPDSFLQRPFQCLDRVCPGRKISGEKQKILPHFIFRSQTSPLFLSPSFVESS